MNRDQIKGYDFTDDIMSPVRVMEQLSAHDERMDDDQPYMALAKNSYSTRFWRYIEGREDADPSREMSRLDNIEVNRIKPALTGYLSSLYPRRIKTSIGPSPYTTGDPSKAELLVNDWLNQPMMRQRILLASRQALLYKGAGAKIGYDPAGEGLNRVWMRAVPYWELVLDADVHDWEDARFIGHVSFQPREEVLEEYGLSDDIKGTTRDDFLGSYLGGSNPASPREGYAESDNQAFVRVLEFCNLVDDFYDTDGTRYKGRLEIYVLDEGYDGAVRPVYMGPLPLVSARGEPLPHIVPLIFEHEPEYPYRGIAYADQLMPQQRELNVMRSYMSSAARRDSRIYLARKGSLDADAYSDLKSGEDGLIIEVDEMYAGSLRDAVVPIMHGPVSANIMQTMQQAELDLERGNVQSPAALGQVTRASATEIQALEGHTQSEYGRHAESRDLWLMEIVRRCLAAHVAAMYDTGDSEGAEEHIDEAGIEKTDSTLSEEREDKGLEDSDEPAQSEEEPEEVEELEEDTEPDDDPFADEEREQAGEEETATPAREFAEVERQVQRTIVLRSPEGESIEIIPEDIDSDFDVGFGEAGRSPMADAEMRQNLVVLSDKLLQLMDIQQKGGPMGVLAEEIWKSIHEKFEFPPNLSPEYVLDRAKDVAPPEAMEGQPGGEAAPSPEGGAGIETVVAQIKELPPQEALPILAQMLEGNPEVLQVIEEAMSGTPEQQQAVVEQILNAIMQQQGA